MHHPAARSLARQSLSLPWTSNKPRAIRQNSSGVITVVALPRRRSGPHHDFFSPVNNACYVAMVILISYFIIMYGWWVVAQSVERFWTQDSVTSVTLEIRTPSGETRKQFPSFPESEMLC